MSQSGHAAGYLGAARERAIDATGYPLRREYGQLLNDIASLLEDGRRSVIRQINTILVETYWQIGQRIVQFEQSGKDRADYGEKLIMNLSRDLSAVYGKGFDERNLRYMRKFYILYLKRYTICTDSKNRNAARSISVKRNAARLESRKKDAARPVFPLAWTNYRALLSIDDEDKRMFYERECERGNWSSRQLVPRLER
jgi:hypothetical protein